MKVTVTEHEVVIDDKVEAIASGPEVVAPVNQIWWPEAVLPDSRRNVQLMVEWGEKIHYISGWYYGYNRMSWLGLWRYEAFPNGMKLLGWKELEEVEND